MPTVAEVGDDEEIISQVTRDPETMASRILRSAAHKVESAATEESHFRIKVRQYMGGRTSFCFSVREVIRDLGVSSMEASTKAIEDALVARRLIEERQTRGPSSRDRRATRDSKGT